MPRKRQTPPVDPEVQAFVEIMGDLGDALLVTAVHAIQIAVGHKPNEAEAAVRPRWEDLGRSLAKWARDGE